MSHTRHRDAYHSAAAVHATNIEASLTYLFSFITTDSFYVDDFCLRKLNQAAAAVGFPSRNITLMGFKVKWANSEHVFDNDAEQTGTHLSAPFDQ